MAPGEAEERNGPVDHFAAERVRQGGRTLGSQTPQEPDKEAETIRFKFRLELD